MADPAESDLNLFDLYEQPQDVAAAKARARALALQRERAMGLADMYTPVPEFQKAGEAQFARAEKERSAVSERMPESVLKLALEKTSQERQLAALQQQIAYQNAQLKLMAAQFGESVRQHGAENLRQDYEAYLRGLHTVPGGLVEREGKTAGELANIENITKEAAKVPIVGGLAEPIGRILGAGKRAELEATAEEKKKGGYRTEAPLSFEEFARARASGAVPHSPAAPAGVSPAVPQAPGGTPSMATQGPAPTHYRYNKDRSMRIPTDASGKPLGPAEPNR